MKARILTTASLLSAFAGVLPAADPQLLNLIMPDAKVVADINVSQAKLSPFGQYVLGQMQNDDLQKLITLTGFDPRKDLTELMVASNGAATAHTGLAVALGNFDMTKITSVAELAGAAPITYKGITILQDTAKTGAVAFINGALMIAGDLANVEASIDRRAAAQTAPASLATLANQLSNINDAWLATTVPPSSLAPSPNVPNVPGLGQQPAFAQVQKVQVGVKFGASIVVTAQATEDNAQDATALANGLQFIANIAQMQAQQNPDAAALAKSLTVTATGLNVNVSASLPQDQFQKLIQPKREDIGDSTGYVRNLRKTRPLERIGR